MKRIYEFVTKANQVLFFLATIGAIVGIGILVYQGTSSHYVPPHVAVAQTAEDIKESTVRDVRFLGQSSELYVFGIVKRLVAPERRAAPMAMASWSKTGEDRGEVVNIVFVKGGRRVKTLLENDGLVLSNNVPGQFFGGKELRALLFLCVTEDTDGNHVLDSNDRNDLYIVARGLEKPDIVIRNVSTFDVTSPTHVVVKTYERDVIRFWDVDVESAEMKELALK
jgi:hypothetical protein